MTHLCLARPEEGRTVPGDQFDCPKCRVVLLDAFRRPADAPETGLRTVPHLFAGPINPTPWVDRAIGPTFAQDGMTSLNCPVCGQAFLSPRLSDHILEAHSPVPQEHTTTIDVHWRGIQQIGIWHAHCSCGWERSGRWERSQGLTWAKGQAKAVAEVHEQMMEGEEL